MENKKVKIVECPRDAMQGLRDFIPTATKAAYINSLLKVGFDTVDFGSFVSPKAMPQMRDTEEVLLQLDAGATNTKLLAIVANYRGAQTATGFKEISQLGFPLSVSETFQQRNTNKRIEEAIQEVKSIHTLCESKGKQLVVYLSMAFGNPYGDVYTPELVSGFVKELVATGIATIAFSDTVGVATPDMVYDLLSAHVPQFSQTVFGVHLHSRPGEEKEKVHAALEAGCRRFDGALLGFGGCPMARDELVGNLATENLISILEKTGYILDLDKEALNEAAKMATGVFYG
ncbi:hydroxymethylglutaryl-CoA lyase [Negadavirga shengliensis]|uniref:Hydroxymethylglutaryl-CoA lyase n=1 Tax=Negadavirga shengliensis TaxID=1389218 RepID=A0ABV9T140_9BACT